MLKTNSASIGRHGLPTRMKLLWDSSGKYSGPAARAARPRPPLRSQFSLVRGGGQWCDERPLWEGSLSRADRQRSSLHRL